MSLSMPSDPNTCRMGSPAGASTLMTSAPQSASSAAADGAATHTPISTTRRPAKVESPDVGSRVTWRPRDGRLPPVGAGVSFMTLPVALTGSSSTISTILGTL